MFIFILCADKRSGLNFSIHWFLDPNVPITNTTWPQVNNTQYTYNKSKTPCLWIVVLIFFLILKISNISLQNFWLLHNGELIWILGHLTWTVWPGVKNCPKYCNGCWISYGEETARTLSCCQKERFANTSELAAEPVSKTVCWSLSSSSLFCSYIGTAWWR